MSILTGKDININKDNNSNVNSSIQNVSDDGDINTIVTRSKSNENNSNSNSVINVDNMNDDEFNESEDEVDDIFVPSDVVYNNNNFEYDYVNRRRYRSEAQKLNDSLSVDPPRSRLRSGK